jgi:hypothetical protein
MRGRPPKSSMSPHRCSERDMIFLNRLGSFPNGQALPACPPISSQPGCHSGGGKMPDSAQMMPAVGQSILSVGEWRLRVQWSGGDGGDGYEGGKAKSPGVVWWRKQSSARRYRNAVPDGTPGKLSLGSQIGRLRRKTRASPLRGRCLCPLAQDCRSTYCTSPRDQSSRRIHQRRKARVCARRTGEGGSICAAGGGSQRFSRLRTFVAEGGSCGVGHGRCRPSHVLPSGVGHFTFWPMRQRTPEGSVMQKSRIRHG